MQQWTTIITISLILTFVENDNNTMRVMIQYMDNKCLPIPY